jgi:hypothetical protein
MRKLSELLNELVELENYYNMIDATMEECDYKTEVLMDLSLSMDFIGCCLMYGDYINDTGKEYNYFED